MESLVRPSAVAIEPFVYVPVRRFCCRIAVDDGLVERPEWNPASRFVVEDAANGNVMGIPISRALLPSERQKQWSLS